MRKAFATLAWRWRWLRWFLGWPGYRMGDQLLGSGDARDQNRQMLGARHAGREPRRPE